MPIHEGLGGYRVRSGAEPIYIHDVCRRVLKEYPGRPDTDDAVWVLRCDECDKVIGEWLTKDEMNMELRAWSRIMDNKNDSMRQVPKRRFSVGRRVLVGVGKRIGTVKSVAEAPSVLGEFVHEVLVDGEQQPLKTVGCDLEAVPDLDEDLQGTNRPIIHIENSNVANLNVGSQVGTINATLESISGSGDAEQEFARALRELTEAVVSPHVTLPDAVKQEVVQGLSIIAEQAAKKPEERSKGPLKAMVAWIPTAISAASNLASLWDKVGPTIRSYLGV